MAKTKSTASALVPKHLSEMVPETKALLAHLDSLMAPDAHHLQTGMRYADNVKYVRATIPADVFNTIDLLQISDMQFGHVQCRYSRVLEYRDWILAEPNRFMLWTGDMIDSITKVSVGDPWENLWNPQGQLYRFCELWAPARHRILGFVGGNHERRPFTYGDLGSEIAQRLRIPYSAGRQIIDIYYGRHKPFKITLWHGSGSARTKGGIAQTLERLIQKGDSQLYLMGHLHQALILPIWKEYRNGRTLKIQHQKVIGALGTSFLETWNTYAEIAGYATHDVMMPCASLTPDGRWELRLR